MRMSAPEVVLVRSSEKHDLYLWTRADSAFQLKQAFSSRPLILELFNEGLVTVTIVGEKKESHDYWSGAFS